MTDVEDVQDCSLVLARVDLRYLCQSLKLYELPRDPYPVPTTRSCATDLESGPFTFTSIDAVDSQTGTLLIHAGCASTACFGAGFTSPSTIVVYAVRVLDIYILVAGFEPFGIGAGG